jgi:hypothetical protein
MFTASEAMPTLLTTTLKVVHSPHQYLAKYTP